AIRWETRAHDPLMEAQMGADLFQTEDGWYLGAVTTNGLNNQWDYGIRNFQDTPFGLFMGTTNEYYGLNVFRATDGPPPAVPAPRRDPGQRFRRPATRRSR